MATITFTTSNPHLGTAVKSGVKFEMRELQNKWKLVKSGSSIKVEFEWSKKDYPTTSEWYECLASGGYEIMLAD